jgi:hypothetical protein
MSEREQSQVSAVVALAGRRIDAAGAEPARFPLEQVPLVRQRVAEALRELRATALVCSAACGADILALEQAERLGVRRRIVLPYAPQRFRETSVTDRPGDWGAKFDRQIASAVATRDLVVLDVAGEGELAYAAANKAIVGEATELARSRGAPSEQRLIALLVWEGSARARGDATADFGVLARQAGFTAQFILTL